MQIAQRRVAQPLMASFEHGMDSNQPVRLEDADLVGQAVHLDDAFTGGHWSGGQGWKFAWLGIEQGRCKFGHPLDLHVGGHDKSCA